MLLSLAWKNIWRNKKRSLIIIMAITFGLWGGLFSDALMLGMTESMVDTAIKRDLAHIQVHKPGYEKDRDIRNYIPEGMETLEKIKTLTGTDNVAGRTLIMGMAASPASAFGVQIIGIIPEQIRNVSDIDTYLYEGEFFSSDRKNQIIVGRKLANRLNLKLRSKVILSFQGLQGEIMYIACRVVGLFKTNSSQFDEANVFVQQSDLFRELNSAPIIHEVALRFNSVEEIEPAKTRLAGALPQLQVETWRELAPELAYLSEMMGIYSYVFVAIILFALLFGITNTMLMSVMDRIRELGVLIAIGMKKGRVFIMIVLETILLSLTGGLAGILTGVISILYFGETGIDLTAVASSLESFGASAMLYPYLPVVVYLILTMMIIMAANIAALLPAWKAVHLEPSQAIRTY